MKFFTNSRKIKALFGFFFHHSSLLTQFLSLIMHHLKYPNSLHPTHLDTVFSFHHSNISTFLWDLYLITKSNLSSVGPTLLKTTKHKAKNKLETTPPKKLKEKISLPLSLSLSLFLWGSWSSTTTTIATTTSIAIVAKRRKAKKSNAIDEKERTIKRCTLLPHQHANQGPFIQCRRW